ncbi:MAG: hypothetical protein IPO15_23245 [Anaerolineae bacterium]|uniref:hypothetical protein n=1 Tax=Candidatus Amarolinea dominans TaxID=3140696 RepID=UPI003134CA1D|nr:hypothetical protein [Anaerolineae bacterium]
MVLGGLVYLLCHRPLGAASRYADQQREPGRALLPSLIAAIGGFRQNFVYEQMGRIVELFSGRRGQNEPSNNTADGGAWRLTEELRPDNTQNHTTPSADGVCDTIRRMNSVSDTSENPLKRVALLPHRTDSIV